MSKLKFPNALVIMIGFILFASLLAYIIPQGEYERVHNAETDQVRVVPGSYHIVDADKLSVFQIIMSVPEGMIERADLIVLILLLGGCFYVIEKTGAVKEGILYLTHKVKGKEEVALIIAILLFVAGGALEGMQEEIIGLTPVLLFFSKRLGYNPIVAVAVSFGAAVVGGAFSPMNPFAVVIAQKIAELPFLSGAGYRLIVFAFAVVLYTVMVIRYANKNKIQKEESTETSVSMSGRSIIILGLVGLAFALLIVGMLKFGWGFNEISAEFFIVGIVAGLIGKLGINGTSEAYAEGFKEMTFAAVIVGLASSITVVLKEGIIIDSIVYGLFLPLEYLPTSLSAVLMMVSHMVLHLPVPSYSGQALLTMPILIPLSDLIGLSRQVCVLAYQYGTVMTDMLIPTNGGLMAILAISGISFNKWLKFILKPTLIILALGAVAIVIAVFIGY